MLDYKEGFCRSTELKPKVYKTTRFAKNGCKTGPLAGVPTLTVEGSITQFTWGRKTPSGYKRPFIHLDLMETDYASRYESFCDYASLDAKATLELYHYRSRQLRRLPAKLESHQDFYDRCWHPDLVRLWRMERRGVELDTDHCAIGKAQSDIDCAKLNEQLCDYFNCTVDWGSPMQLKGFLQDQLMLPRPPIKGTLKAISKADPDEYSTAEASIYWLETKCEQYRAGLKLLREWRKKRRLGQYLRDLPGNVAPDGRLHTVLSPEADTGRLSARFPPLQQIPGAKKDPYGIRRAFVAGPGRKLVVADFSQLEVYILAHVLIKLFNDDSVYVALQSGDVYSWVAKTCWPDKLAGIDLAAIKDNPDPAIASFRDLAKILVLATNYGKTPMGLSLQLLDELGEPADESYCEDLLLTYFGRMQGVQKYQAWITAYAAKNGGTPSLLGRWRPVPLAMSELRWEARRGARQALNGPIQGGARDVMMMAALGMNTYTEVPGYLNQRLAQLGAYQLLDVHDELILDCPAENAPEVLALVKHGMEHPPGIDLMVQLRCEAKIADCWADGK
jgi:DNA polymerase-1